MDCSPNHLATAPSRPVETTCVAAAKPSCLFFAKLRKGPRLAPWNNPKGATKNPAHWGHLGTDWMNDTDTVDTARFQVAIAQQIQQLGMQQQYHQVRSYGIRMFSTCFDSNFVIPLKVFHHFPSFSMQSGAYKLEFSIPKNAASNAAILEFSHPHIKTNWDSN